MTRRTRAGALFIFRALSCDAAPINPGPINPGPINPGPINPGPIDPAFDYHSYANVDQFRTTHLDLDLRVDFAFKNIAGSVTLELKRLDPRSTQLVLDTKDLMILEVTQKATAVLGATAKSQAPWTSQPFHL